MKATRAIQGAARRATPRRTYSKVAVAFVLGAALSWATPTHAGFAQTASGLPEAQRGEVVAEVRVQGNQITPDAELIRLAGVIIGAPFTATTTSEIAERLRRTGRFDDVQVLKRFASIADPLQIVIVLIVNEGPVRIEVPDDGGPLRVVRRRRLTNVLFMPLLDVEDGYGVTYGVRLAYAGVAGKRSRLSFPLTWGGLKRAGVEFDRAWDGGPISRLEIGSAIERRRNPAFDEDDDRRRVWARAGRAVGPLRIGGGAGWQRVSFAGTTDRLRTLTADVALDTRLDPVLPRNAVYAMAAIERVYFASGAAFVDRTTVEGRGYLGLVGQSVLVVRARREQASRAVPPYLKALLGGDGNLRGFRPGAFVGDVLVAGSVELRVPLSAALAAGKVGVSVFLDAGTAYDREQTFRDQTLHTGGGGSVWLSATAFRMALTIAHGRGAGTRTTVSAGVSF